MNISALTHMHTHTRTHTHAHTHTRTHIHTHFCNCYAFNKLNDQLCKEAYVYLPSIAALFTGNQRVVHIVKNNQNSLPVYLMKYNTY